MLEGLLSIHTFAIPILFFFVPGAILIFYWKGRRLFLRDSPDWIFPALLSVMVSVISMGAAIVPLRYLDKNANAWIIVGMSAVPIFNAVVLTELLVPQTLPSRWALKPAPAWILSGVLGWVSGLGDWVVFWHDSPWLTGAGTMVAICLSFLVYRRTVRSHPDMAAFVAHFFAWMGMLVLVMLYSSVFLHG